MSLLRPLAEKLGISFRLLHSRSVFASPSIAHLQRHFSNGTIDDFRDEIDEINDAFVEARDEIEYATEDAETVYFNESANAARQIVEDVLERFHNLLGKLSEEERGKLQRSMGMKMEQLKAELEQLDHIHAD